MLKTDSLALEHVLSNERQRDLIRRFKREFNGESNETETFLRRNSPIMLVALLSYQMSSHKKYCHDFNSPTFQPPKYWTQMDTAYCYTNREAGSN